MRIVIQRVKSSVTVNGQVVGKIGRGLNLLVGIASSDTEADWMARKCLELRLFPDEEGGANVCRNPFKKLEVNCW